MAPVPPDQRPDAWDEVAELYTTYIDPVTSPFGADLLEAADLRPGQRVLDVACGPGATALPAAERAGHVVGLDFSAEMVKLLVERASRRGLTNVEGRHGDAQDLPFDDGGFDRAISNFGVMFAPDRGRAFGELHRVLVPEGRVAVTTWRLPPETEWFAVMMGAMGELMPGTAPNPPTFFEVADADRLRSELEAAGFRDVAVRPVRHEIEWPDADAATRMLAEANPLFKDLVGALGGDAQRVLETVRRHVPVADGGRVRMAGTANLAVAVKR